MCSRFLPGCPADFSGEIAISVNRASEQASEFGHSLTEEIKILMLHGVLHLLGMDHEKDRGAMAPSREDAGASSSAFRTVSSSGTQMTAVFLIVAVVLGFVLIARDAGPDAVPGYCSAAREGTSVSGAVSKRC